MSHAEKCPVCYGTGVLPVGTPRPLNVDNQTAMTCHGCGGKGWVTVQSVQTTPYIDPRYSIYDTRSKP